MTASTIRVQVLSDLHSEFGARAVPRPATVAADADIVLVAGDLASAPDAVAIGAALFATAPALILIGGNHEHYQTGLTIDESLDAMRRAAAVLSVAEGRVVAVLENEVRIVPVREIDVRVIGSTLWTDYGLLHQPISHAALCERAINDHRLILGRDGGLFTAHEAADRHRASRAFLASTLAEPHHGPTIVVTHHLPAMRSVAGRFRRDPISAGFASHADDLVAMSPALWVHGHTHDSFVWRDGGGTLVVCNPAGYARPDGSRENPEFEPTLCVAIQRDGEAWRASTTG